MVRAGHESSDPRDDLVEDENKVAPELADRLRKAAEGLGGVTIAAQRAGIPQRSLSYYLAGRDMKRAALVAYADATEVNLEWLATGRGPMQNVFISYNHEDKDLAEEVLEKARALTHPSTEAPSSDVLGRFVSIPRYNIEVSAGPGALAQHEQVVDYLAFDGDFIRQVIQRKPENLVLIEARGDSMDPTIRDRDLLLVDMTDRDRIENSCIYVLQLDDILLVKRIQRRIDGSMVVLSDNTRYAPETVSAADFKQLRIIGQVIWQAGPVRS